MKVPLTPIDGKLFIKFFWGCTYESKNVKPVKKLFNIYKLYCYICVKPKRDKFGIIYKNDCIEMLKKNVSVKEETFNINFEKVCGDKAVLRMTSCHSKQDDSYIGTPEDIWTLIYKYGITDFYKARNDHSVASIGFNFDERKWYGWSHRAIYGFGLGYIVKEGELCTTSGYTKEYEKEHPEDDLSVKAGFECKDESDCKRVAIAFACSVS